MMVEQTKYGFLIPVYNHGKELYEVLKNLEVFSLPFIIIDDGSDQETKNHLQKICEIYPRVNLVELPQNIGKGGAVSAGIHYAFHQGYSHVFQIDADGQHDTSCCTTFLEHSYRFPQALICGEPVYDDTVPKSRLNGRKIGNTWVKIITWSQDIRDAMCGFRIYPVNPCEQVISRTSLIDKRMGFDLEILIRLKWKNLALIYLPVKVTYPENGISHYHLVRDNVRLSIMFTRTFFGMLLRIPIIIARKIMKRKRSNER